MKEMQRRSLPTAFETREDGGKLYIEGYFAVFESNYHVYDGCTESIAAGAFAKSLGNDIRALINHETRLVLGRNKAGTLELREDSRGLWGRIEVNPNDSDAMNLYERVKRGDVDQCSFGGFITMEEGDFRDNGTAHWTIKEFDLHEVTVATFPAYTETSVAARGDDLANMKKRKADAWKHSMHEKLKGDV